MRSAEGIGLGVLPVRIALFGPPLVTSADGSHRFPLPRKTLDVLAYLILNRHRTLSRATAAFTLFPDDLEEVARGSLRRNLSYLMSSLPSAPKANRFVLADGETISWNPSAAAAVDVEAFERAIAENRDDDAVAEYTGELLPTLYADWTMMQRERLRNDFHDTLVRTMQRDRSMRRFDLASAAARRLLNDDPWREDIVRQFIAIRYESGDRAGALAEFERFAARLRSEMHTDPMPETIAIREAVVRGARLSTSEPARSQRPGEVVPPSGLPLVGRGAAMETALARWHVVADGRAGILFVAGEAGIGKSRFAAELARVIEREGGLVIRGETSAGGEQYPYEAFISALRQAAPEPGRGSVQSGADLWHDRAEQLLNEHADATLTDDRAARVRLFDAVRRSIAGLARARPLAVVLEDLHWAGADTIALLDFVGLRLSHAPVLIVVTMRTDEFPRAHPLRGLLRQLKSRGTADVTTLQRLTALEAADALRAVRLPQLDDDAISRAVTWADGVPLLLAEALRDLSAGRSIPTGDISELVGERFARLTPAGETALVYAAIVGARFELATLAAVTGWSDDALIEALGESIELGFIRIGSNAPGLTFEFAHHLLHAAARERIASSDRLRAHAMIARVLEALPNSRGSRASEIARQFEAAGEPVRAAGMLLHAARHALSVFANDDARETATAGLAIAGDETDLRYGLLAAREQALRRIGALAERRADAKQLLACAGDNTERACEALERVFEAHLGDEDACRGALAVLERLASSSERHAAIFDRVTAKHAFLTENYSKARDAAISASERFERIGDERAALLARLQHIAALGRMSAFAEAETAIARLRPIIEASEDIALAAEFYRVAVSASSDERRDNALLDARRSVELALRVGDRYAEARARQNLAALVGKLRNYEEAGRENERALAAYRDVADTVGINDLLLNLTAVRVACGDYREARRLLEALQPAADRTHWVTLRATMCRGIIDMREGHFVRAARAFTTARKNAAKLGIALYVARSIAFLGEVRAMSGLADEARMLLDEAIARFVKLGQPALCAEARALSAHLYAGVGDAEAARAEALRAQQISESVPVQDYSQVAWHLAATNALLGDREAAIRFAEASARAFAEDALRMEADLAETYAHLPWHRYAFAYLAGRDVPLRLDERRRPATDPV